MNGKRHLIHLITSGTGFWKWHCSCGRESRQRFEFRGLAYSAGHTHADMKNRALQ